MQEADRHSATHVRRPHLQATVSSAFLFVSAVIAPFESSAQQRSTDVQATTERTPTQQAARLFEAIGESGNWNLGPTTIRMNDGGERTRAVLVGSIPENNRRRPMRFLLERIQSAGGGTGFRVEICDDFVSEPTGDPNSPLSPTGDCSVHAHRYLLFSDGGPNGADGILDSGEARVMNPDTGQLMIWAHDPSANLHIDEARLQAEYADFLGFINGFLDERIEQPITPAPREAPTRRLRTRDFRQTA